MMQGVHVAVRRVDQQEHESMAVADWSTVAVVAVVAAVAVRHPLASRARRYVHFADAVAAYEEHKIGDGSLWG